MIPPQPLHLFAPQYAEPIDTSTQVRRLPPHDAPCLCGRDDCAERGYPWCVPPKEERDDE